MALRTARWDADRDTVTRAKGQWGSAKYGSPERKRLTAGKREGYVYRSYLRFAMDQSDIGVLKKATLVLHTNEADFPLPVNPKLRMHRITKSWPEGTGNGWTKGNAVNAAVASGRVLYGKHSETAPNVEVRFDVTALVGPWLKKYRQWMDGNTSKAGWDKSNYGIRLKSVESGNEAWKNGWQFFSREADDQAMRPYIEIEYEPPNYAPDVISTIAPSGTVLPGTDFTGEFGDPNGDPPANIRVQVRRQSNDNVVWDPTKFPFDLTWVDQGATWLWQVPNPGSGVLKAGIAYEWRAKGFDGRGKDSGWTSWRGFTQSGTVPTATLRPLGTLPTLQGASLESDYVVASGERVVSYRVQLKADADLWSSPKWDEEFSPLTEEEKSLGHLRFPYGGVRLAAGTYQVRLLVVDSLGVASAWSAEDTLVLTVGSEEDDDQGGAGPPANTSGYARGRSRVRIVLRDVDGANRGPGTVKAIIEDAHNIGMSAVVNEPGEFYFTLTSLHPQAGECEPYQRHYALQQYRNGAWKDIANGILTDFDAGEDDIIIYGTDYMGMLGRSIDTRFPPPGTNIHASHANGGAKYKDKTISSIVVDQLDEAKAQVDSPLAFFNNGTIQTLNTKVSIYSSFKQRLDFIRGLLESHRQGSGKRTRLKARKDPAQKDRWEWDLRNQPGIDRDNLRLEYGSVLQNFRVIAMGQDYATRAHGVGTEPNNVKPRYFVYPPVGDSDFLTATFGNLQRVEVFNDIIDKNDLKRRVRQMQKESSKVGKRIRLALRVHGVNPFDGYDLTDNVPLDIDRGLVETDRYGSGYWTIWGLEYRVYPDGHDEVTWAVKPREDDETPDPDLIPSDPIHYTPEWYIGNGPPPACDGTAPVVFAVGEDDEPVVTPCDCYFYLDMDNGMTYHRAENPEYDTWVEDGLIPGDPLVVPPGYPGDGVAPDEPTSVTLAPTYFEHDDGTSEPILILEWVDAANPDIMGYEVQWDATVLDQGDPPAPIAPDFTTFQSVRFGVATQFGQLTPVIGGNWYGARIRAYDMEGLFSDWVLSPLVQSSPDDSAPDIPTGIGAAGGYRIIGATWDAASAPDLSFYEFRYRVTGDPEWSNRFKAKSNRIIIDGLLDEQEYEVQARAIDRSGNVRVSGDPQQGDEVIANHQDDTEAGWSDIATATTTLIVPESVAFKNIVAEFISTGVISADQIFGGDLLLGSPGHEGTIRIYDDQGRATGAWGDFGWIIADPENPGRAIWAIAGAIYFTSQYDWDGTETRDPPDENGLINVTAGIEQGIPTTTWTTAIDWKGINAESITFGSQFGGNNRLLNAGFELQDFDTATLVEKEYTDNSDWGSPTGNINTDVSGTELRMVSH